MRQVTGNLWQCHKLGNTVVITTNGAVRKDGLAVMGRGTAFQAMQKYPALAVKLGIDIKLYGNHVRHYPEFRIITFPVKHHWADDADLELIERSVGELLRLADDRKIQSIYLTRPGCGNGRLNWKDVEPLLAPLDNRFTMVNL